MDGLSFRVKGGYIAQDVHVEHRRLVAHEPLVALRKLSPQEVIDGEASEVAQVLIRVFIPAPAGALDPQPQVLRVQQRVVERARLYLRSNRFARLHPFKVFVSQVPAEEPAAAATQYLRMCVQDLHQPAGTGFGLPHDEERRRSSVRRLALGQLCPGPREFRFRRCDSFVESCKLLVLMFGRFGGEARPFTSAIAPHVALENVCRKVVIA